MVKFGCEEGNQDDCPLKHTFAPGIYVREIFIPKDKVLIGRIHRHEHPNFLMSGKVAVITESKGRELLVAPLSIISPAGTKRVVIALEDSVWITVHLNLSENRNTDELEDELTVKSYQEYELEHKKGGTLCQLQP